MSNLLKIGIHSFIKNWNRCFSVAKDMARSEKVSYYGEFIRSDRVRKGEEYVQKHQRQ